MGEINNEANKILEETQALNRITLDLLAQKKKEHTKSLYESCSKSLIDMGNISDSLWVEQLIKDVSSELDMLYDVMLRLRASNYDVVYTLDIQQELHKKYN